MAVVEDTRTTPLFPAQTSGKAEQLPVALRENEKSSAPI
jgi:hypothetical protein